MNWIALGAVSELNAAIASFLFIKQKMKQNHDATKASHQREILNASRDFFMPVYLKSCQACCLRFEVFLHLRQKYSEPLSPV